MVKNKKELEIILSRVPGFKKPSIRLEQYACDSIIAANLLWLAHMYKDIEGKVVIDLGCGTGILSYGALLIGAKEVLCIDIDVEVLKIAQAFFLEKGFYWFEVIGADVEHLWFRGIDTIIMNPPFGVHRRGVDLLFLKKALELKPRAIYTIHKYNPESHRIVCETVQNNGYTVKNTIIGTMRIPAIHIKHKKHIHRFKVAIYAISRG